MFGVFHASLGSAFLCWFTRLGRAFCSACIRRISAIVSPGFGMILSNSALHRRFQIVQHVHIHNTHHSSFFISLFACSCRRALIHLPIDSLVWCPSCSPNILFQISCVHTHLKMTCSTSSSWPHIEQFGSTSICLRRKFVLTARALDNNFHIKCID